MRGSIGAALLAMFVADAAKGESPPAPLSLQAALAEAHAKSPEVGEIDARLLGAEAVYKSERRVFRNDPELSGAVSRGGAGESGSEFEASLTLDPLSPAWGPRRASARADLTTAQAEQRNARRALDEAVAIAVADLAFAQSSGDRREKIAAVQQLAAEYAEKQFALGRGTRLDVDGALLDAAASRADLADAGSDLAAARTSLARLLGRETATGLSVEDPLEAFEGLDQHDLDASVEGDPRVEAATSEARAAILSRRASTLSLLPAPTVAAGWAKTRQEIPAGSFQGIPGAEGESAGWTDTEMTLRISIPIPLFDRQRESRSTSFRREIEARAGERVVRADVRSELEAAWASLRASRESLEALRGATEILQRDLELVEQAVRAGALDSVERGVVVRRLVETGERTDRAILTFRTARARWLRRSTAP